MVRKVVFVLALISTLLVSCNETEQYHARRAYLCNPEQSEGVLRFIQDNLLSANNMSDEEMEDVIIELKRTAILLKCRQVIVKVGRHGAILYEDLEKADDESLFLY